MNGDELVAAFNSFADFNGEDSRLGHISKYNEPDVGSTVCNAQLVPVSMLHFFVRLMTEGNTIVIHANSDDSVESVHEQIRKITGIPIIEQRLIYRGKQLQWELSLAECSIQNDAGLQLVGRMRSSDHPRAWQLINDLVCSICRLIRSGDSDSLRLSKFVKSCVKEFLKMTSTLCDMKTLRHIQIFQSSGAVAALFMLFLSPIQGNKDCAEESIQFFLKSNIEKSTQAYYAPLVLEFCNLLRKSASEDDSLYISCRNTLGLMLKTIGVAHGSKYFDNAKASIVIEEFFPFVSELASGISGFLRSSLTSLDSDEGEGSSISDDIHAFSAFLLPLCEAIEDEVEEEGFSIPMFLYGNDDKHPYDWDKIESLHVIFVELLENFDQCLERVEEFLVEKGTWESKSHQSFWSLYLVILKGLKSICKLYQGADKKLYSMMRSRRTSLDVLISIVKLSEDTHKRTKHNEDHFCPLDKDAADCEYRRHRMQRHIVRLHEVKHEYAELLEMLIDK